MHLSSDILMDDFKVYFLALSGEYAFPWFFLVKPPNYMSLMRRLHKLSDFIRIFFPDIFFIKSAMKTFSNDIITSTSL